MQIIFLPTEWSFLICFILWPVFQISISIICLIIPDDFYAKDNFLFRVRKWENQGNVYESIFRIRRWKQFLPDGAAIIKSGFRKKHLQQMSVEYFKKFLVESRRAELGHWVAITPFWIFGFFTPFPVIIYMFLYAIIINLPCILAQRYNRPRLFEVLKKLEERE